MKTMNSIFESLYFKEVSNNCVSLEENKDNVNMKLQLYNIKNKSVLLSKFEGQGKFPLFKNKKCADYILLEFIENDKINMHIFELKKKLCEDTWEKIKMQFLGAFYKSLIIFPFYNFNINNIEKIYAYTIITDFKFKDSINYRYKNPEWEQKVLNINNFFRKEFNHQTIKIKEKVVCQIDFSTIK